MMYMNMNIYISKENEEWLRAQGKSMSGIINELLARARKAPITGLPPLKDELYVQLKGGKWTKGNLDPTYEPLE